MCKPTCCSSSSTNGSGLGAAIAVLVGILVISAIARPVIHAAEDILRIVLIAASTLVGLAITVAVTVFVVRVCRTRRTHPVISIRSQQVPETSAPQAFEIEPGIWTCVDPQRQILPAYGNSAMLHRKIQAALEAGQQVIVIDGKTGTWS